MTKSYIRMCTPCFEEFVALGGSREEVTIGGLQKECEVCGETIHHGRVHTPWRDEEIVKRMQVPTLSNLRAWAARLQPVLVQITVKRLERQPLYVLVARQDGSSTVRELDLAGMWDQPIEWRRAVRKSIDDAVRQLQLELAVAAEST